MNVQPLIAVYDVAVSSHWYQAALGAESGHDGLEYEQIRHKDRMILQLHHWDAHEHPSLGNQTSKPYGTSEIYEKTRVHRAFLMGIALFN